jgi:hypothetical protein
MIRASIALAVLMVVATGCCPRPEIIQPVESVIRQYNENANGVDRLWARAKVEVTLANDAGLTATWGSVSSAATPNALLLMSRRDDSEWDFVLIGKEIGGVELFRMGISGEENAYYFWYNFGGEAVAYWGRNDLAGAPGVAGMPIYPADLLAALGLTAMPTDLTNLPAAVMTMRDKECNYAYELTSLDRQPITNIFVRRKTYLTWSDELPPRPFAVDLFDAQGLCSVSATLANEKPIETDGDQVVVAPTELTLVWNDPAWPVRKLRIVLSEMSAVHTFRPEACRFRDHMPRTAPENIIQIDGDIQP